ncbi:MAG: hypothetical protein PHR94_08620 [Methylomonas lenta]|nr:hypothetical protein [Methylomonas lenta]
METLQSAGELGLLGDEGVKVRCALIFEGTWQTDLAKLIENAVNEF